MMTEKQMILFTWALIAMLFVHLSSYVMAYTILGIVFFVAFIEICDDIKKAKEA